MIQWKQYLIVVFAALAAFFMTLTKIFYLGKKTEQQKQTDNALKAAITRLEVDNDINKKSDADVRTELSSWLRNK
ncbi:hypothetical protein [Bartonella sp. A05]|uniref:hypothetical protein n=1 Tax=Bartonella sp. A05 TaxID=2967261 RepID=UPI0022A9DC24|nr:hypothetical protein [Bartonella sp. A05]MCZ2203985.1 hypothetical protein [Bartonella sp. A05]